LVLFPVRLGFRVVLLLARLGLLASLGVFFLGLVLLLPLLLLRSGLRVVLLRSCVFALRFLRLVRWLAWLLLLLRLGLLGRLCFLWLLLVLVALLPVASSAVWLLRLRFRLLLRLLFPGRSLLSAFGSFVRPFRLLRGAFRWRSRSLLCGVATEAPFKVSFICSNPLRRLAYLLRSQSLPVFSAGD
jgi:hypothetical protein